MWQANLIETLTAAAVWLLQSYRCRSQSSVNSE